MLLIISFSSDKHVFVKTGKSGKGVQKYSGAKYILKHSSYIGTLLRFRDLSIAQYSFSNVCGGLARSLRHICACEAAARSRNVSDIIFIESIHERPSKHTSSIQSSMLPAAPSIRSINCTSTSASAAISRGLEHYLTKSVLCYGNGKSLNEHYNETVRAQESWNDPKIS